MLPEPYRQLYQNLLTALEHFHAAIAPDAAEESALESQFQTVREQAQPILALTWDDLDPLLVSRLRSLSTEINKQLRMLGTDVLFLKTARQPETIAQRQTQIRDRIQQLMGYCQASLEVGS